MRKILITGGAGFIASNLAEELVKDGNNLVIIVDNLLTGDKGKLPKENSGTWKFIECDVNNYRSLAEIMFTYQFDYVFHYAAVVGVKRTLEKPVSVLEDIEGIKNILELSKNTNVKRVFYSSSSEVYGEPVEFPQNEHTTPLNSRLPYAIVKNIGEAYLRSYKQEYGLDYTIFRFFNTYGPKQSKNFVISKFLVKALNNENITVYGDGLQTRTFCYINDNIDTSLKALYEDEFINDVINIGGALEITILDLAKTIIRVTGSSSKIVHLPALEDGDMRRRLPDNTKMLKLLDRDLLSLENGLKTILKEGLFELNSVEETKTSIISAN